MQGLAVVAALRGVFEKRFRERSCKAYFLTVAKYWVSEVRTRIPG
jgi:hypothetical protein